MGSHCIHYKGIVKNDFLIQAMEWEIPAMIDFHDSYGSAYPAKQGQEPFYTWGTEGAPIITGRRYTI